MKNLIKAVLEVMKAVKGMEKNSRVGSGTAAYNGTKYQDVAEVFNAAMADNGLVVFPMDIEESTQVERWEETNNYGTKQKQSVFTKVKTKYLLCHESGESQEIIGYGHGVDSQDKGAGKATTYALKNALLYTFLTPVGKMDDADVTHSNDIATPQKTTPKQPTVMDAVSEIKASKDINQCSNIWSKYKVFQQERLFIDAKDEAKKICSK